MITNDYNIRWVGGCMITERVVQQMITLYYESGGSTQGISYAKFIKGIHRIKRKIYLACISIGQEMGGGAPCFGRRTISFLVKFESSVYVYLWHRSVIWGILSHI